MAARICTVQVAFRGYCPVKGYGVTSTQYDQPSLMLLSVSSCGRLQLEVARQLLQVADNKIDPTSSGCKFSTGGFTLFSFCIFIEYYYHSFDRFTLPVFCVFYNFVGELINFLDL